MRSPILKDFDQGLSRKVLGYFLRGANPGPIGTVAECVIAHGSRLSGEEQAIIERPGELGTLMCLPGQGAGIGSPGPGFGSPGGND